MKKREKKSHQKVCIKDYKTRIEEANRNLEIKNIIDFDENNFNSIKSLAVKTTKT